MVSTISCTFWQAATYKEFCDAKTFFQNPAFAVIVDLVDFGVQVAAVSASGVLAPGPLFFTNMLYGTKQGVRSGLKMAYGHTVVELPFVILLAAGLFSTAIAGRYASATGLIGGVAILGFAAVQIIDVARKRRGQVQRPVAAGNKSPFIAGIALTALNPFFYVWWFTVGLKLITDSATFGLAAGIAILFGFHIWMDYAWLAATAHLASRGSSVLESRYYPLLLLGLAGVLAYYGITYVLHALA
jgi:threonine/homoserine/homoserine lactone efflux protein